MAWVKSHDCIVCGLGGPSIVDHMYGSTFKHNKILIGMWALLPYCMMCDDIKTRLGRKEHDRVVGRTQAQLFIDLMPLVPETLKPPVEVMQTIEGWGR